MKALIVDEKLGKTGSGWDLILTISLDYQKLEKLKNELKCRLKDYVFYTDNNRIICRVHFKITEPWEDEPPEEVAETIKLEIMSHIKTIMGSGAV